MMKSLLLEKDRFFMNSLNSFEFIPLLGHSFSIASNSSRASEFGCSTFGLVWVGGTVVTDPSTGLLYTCAGTTATGISSVSDVRWRFLAVRPAVVQKLLVNL